MSAQPQSLAVLGAGMLGLTLALRAAARGRQVTVLEAAPEIGGLTTHFRAADTVWDRYYHVIDGSDAALLTLLGQLGLDDAVEWRTTRTLLFDGARHYPLDNAADYLRLPTLRLVDKLRVGANIVYAGARRSRGGLESLPASAWLSRWSGERAYRELWAPLLRSKLGSNYERVSAAFIWSVIRRFYGARQGSRRTEQFGFMPGGYARIIDALLAALDHAGVAIETSRPVTTLAAAHGGVRVAGPGHERVFDQAVATFAGPLFARMVAGLPADEHARHADLPYQGVVCQSLLVTRPFGGAYMTYITDNSVPFTTVIEMSALTGPAAFGGHHLVYLPRYVPSDDPLFESSDEAVAAEFQGALARLYPDFRPEQVVASRVARARHVMALPTLGYSGRLAPMATSIPGLSVCNSSHIVDASLSVNEAVALADAAMPAILDHV